jgi:ferredoxin
MSLFYKVTVLGNEPKELKVKAGETLRSALLKEGCSPYRGQFRAMNCRGMGICGSCWVQVKEKGEFWQRRSCQIQCFQDLEIQLQ